MIDKASLIYYFLNNFEEMYKQLLINLKVSDEHIDFLIGDNYDSYKHRVNNIYKDLNNPTQEKVNDG